MIDIAPLAILKDREESAVVVALFHWLPVATGSQEQCSQTKQRKDGIHIHRLRPEAVAAPPVISPPEFELLLLRELILLSRVSFSFLRHELRLLLFDRIQHCPEDRVVIYEQVAFVILRDRLGDNFLHGLRAKADVFPARFNAESISGLVLIAQWLQLHDCPNTWCEPSL